MLAASIPLYTRVDTPTGCTYTPAPGVTYVTWLGSARHRWRVHGTAVIAGAAAAALLGMQGAAAALAGCGNVGAAQITGSWQVRTTFVGWSGSPPPGTTRVPGTVTTESVGFASGCSTTGQCGVLMQGNQPGQLTFFGQSGLEGPQPDHPLIEQGSSGTWASTFLPGGIGGRNLPPCSPPHLTRTLSFSVLSAVQSPSAPNGWQANVMSGTEHIAAWWACVGSTGVISSVENYTMVAVPQGASFPQGSVISCGAAVPGIAVSNPGAVRPSSFSSALATPQQSFGSVGSTVVNLVITVALVLFITFPAQLFNKTLEENYDDIRDILTRRFGWVARMRREVASESTGETRLAVFAGVVLIGAFLGSLNDPGFGFNGSSALTYLGVVASMMAALGLGTTAARLYRRARGEDASGHLHALPAGLLVAGACVLLSRSTHFTPGYLYGVIFGVAFTRKLDRSRESVGIVVATATTLTFAVLAWLLWLPAHDRTFGDSANPGLILAVDVLAALVVGGFVGSVIGLFPLRFLSGGTLFGWNRGVWAGTFGLALFGLIQVLLHPGESPAHSGNAPVVTAVVLFGVFGAVSVGFNQYFERRKRRRAQAALTAGPA